MIRRRTFLLAASGLAAGRPLVIDTHIHLFASDKTKFPPHANASYRDYKLLDVANYCRFAAQAGIAHTIIVHPEPYQDDHSYLEYSFTQEQPKGFFKGTCLFDPIRPDTPRRMEEIVKRNPNRIVAIRIHSTRPTSKPATTSGPMRDRDLTHPGFRNLWRKAGDLGLAVQCHAAPPFHPQIAAIARDFPKVKVVVDHLGHGGTEQARFGYRPGEFDNVLALAKLPQVILKVSALRYSSRQPYPHEDIKPLIRSAFQAFGPERMIWGGLGATMKEHEEYRKLFEHHFDFASGAERERIMGLNAKALYGF